MESHFRALCALAVFLAADAQPVTPSLIPQCQALDRARAAGQINQQMAQQGMIQRLSQQCAQLKRTNPGAFQQMGSQPTQSMRTASGNTGGKAVAMGCSALLKAKNNGRMDWFESQGWYQKALKVCTNLAGRSPEEQMQTGKQLQREAPLALLKETCQKLAMTDHGDEVRRTDLFNKAEKICVNVRSASPQELQDLVHRQAHSAETASGQLIKQTCGQLQYQVKMGKMQHLEHAPWYPSMLAMCKEMGTQKVSVSVLQQRCTYFKRMKQQGKEQMLKKQSWYERLNKVCKWLEQRKQQKGQAAGRGQAVMV